MGIPWKYNGIKFEDDNTPPIVNEVVDILDMWSFIEDSYNSFSATEKEAVVKEAEPFGKDPVFRGFDGNNETDHMSVAMFLIDDLGRFSNFKGRSLNAHMPTIETHRRMYRVFKPIRTSLGGRLLNTEEMVRVLAEITHPEYREDR